METQQGEIRFEGCGHVFRDLRVESGFTLRELADRVGTAASTLSKIESNSLSIPLRMIEQIATALNRSPERIALRCLEVRFPRLREAAAGRVVSKYLTLSSETDQ